MIEFASVLLFWSGLFGIVDAAVEKKRKIQIGEFIFGFHDRSAKEFEKNVIHALLSVFIIEGKLKKWRVFVFSCTFTCFTAVIFLLFLAVVNVSSRDEISIVNAWFLLREDFLALGDFGIALPVIVSILLLSLFAVSAYPLDLASIAITKKIFWNRKYGWLSALFRVILDGLLSMGVVLLVMLLGGLFQLSFLSVGAMIHAPSMMLISIIQIAVLAAGLLLRTILRMTKVNMYVAMWTNFHETPFLFLGILVGAFSGLIYAWLL